MVGVQLRQDLWSFSFPPPGALKGVVVPRPVAILCLLPPTAIPWCYPSQVGFVKGFDTKLR